MRITIEPRDLSYRQYTERISVTKFGHVNESNYIHCKKCGVIFDTAECQPHFY